MLSPTTVNFDFEICAFFGEHIIEMCKHLSSASLRISQDVLTFTHFLSSVLATYTSYEKQLFNHVQDLQLKIKRDDTDTLLANSYHLLSSIFLRTTEQHHKQSEVLTTILRSGQNADFEFKQSSENFIFSLKVSGELLISETKELREAYSEAFKNFLPSSTSNQNSQPEFLSATEEDLLQIKAEKLNQKFRQAKLLLTQTIRDLFEAENNVKMKVKSLVTKTGEILEPSAIELHNSLMLLASEIGHSIFEELEKKQQLPKGELNFFALTGFSLRRFEKAAKIENSLEHSYGKQLAAKVYHISEDIDPCHKIGIQMFLEFIFKEKAQIVPEMMENVEILLHSRGVSSYAIFSMILRKSINLSERPLTNFYLKEPMFSNIKETCLRILMILEKIEVDSESLYHFLRFILTVFSDKKESLAGYLNGCNILTNLATWASIQAHLEQFFIEAGSAKDKMVLGFRALFTTTKDPREQGRMRAFEEVSLILFRMKLEFEKISEILFSLARNSKIPFETVKLLLQQNQDLFFSQVSQAKIFSFDLSETFRKSAQTSKDKKFLFVFKRTYAYLQDIKVLVQLCSLSKFFKSHKAKLLHSALYRSQITDPVRAAIYFQLVDFSHMPKKVKSHFTAKECESIITLDVKRTNCFSSSFSQQNLEKVLRKVADPDLGKFQYYQGLNYIAAYILMLYESNVYKTYSVLITLLHKYFSEYVDKDLGSIKKLFFFTKRLLATYNPQLHSFLENEVKVNLDIVMASWCLTLFTTVIQTTPKSSILDQIMDVFVAKGWPGFFQCVLTLLEVLSERLYSCGYEDILMNLSEMSKNGFQDIIKVEGEDFNLKERLVNFKHINKATITLLNCQYQQIKDCMEEHWIKISKKLRGKSFVDPKPGQ